MTLKEARSAMKYRRDNMSHPFRTDSLLRYDMKPTNIALLSTPANSNLATNTNLMENNSKDIHNTHDII